MNTTPTSPVELVKNAVTKKYFNFTGRARRSEYWYFQLFFWPLAILCAFADIMVFGFNLETEEGFSPFTTVFTLLTLIPSISVAVRRLHDGGRSGWFYLLNFIPLLGPLVLLFFYIQDSEPQPNKWGPFPKYGGGTAFAGQAAPSQYSAPPTQPSAGARMGLEADRLPDDDNFGRGGGFGRP